MALAQDALLGVAMRFRVEVDGIDLGGWNRCSGLSVNFDPQAVKEGGAHDHVQYLSGHISYSSVTLVRAITATDFDKVQGWLAGKADDYAGGTASITLLDAHGEKVATWALRNVFPSSWKGPDLNATANAVALETLELVHEGFL